jgi:histidinol-phosphate aminotransferase
MLKPRKAIESMPAYHAPSAERLGLNLDLNENTGGCSPRVLQKLASLTTTDISAYPDREAGERIAARFFRLSPNQVLLTNGVDEALQLLAFTYLSEGDEVIVTEPTFNMYALDVAATGATLVTVGCDRDFAFPADKVIAAISPRTKLIAIANPNNPTATIASRADLIRMIEAAPNVAVLVDEAYFEFYGETVLDLLPGYPNLFVSRTFSKAYGLAGLRIGAILGDPEQIGYIRRITPPFNVNVIALACLPVAIGDQQFVAGYVRQVFDGRSRLQSLCAELGLRFWPSYANFVLVNIGPRHRECLEAMQQRGINLRDRNSDPRCEGCVRITIGTTEQNELLLTAIREVCRAGILAPSPHSGRMTP